MGLGLIWPITGYWQTSTISARIATPAATPKENGLTESPYLIVLYGAGTMIRTRDLLITNQFCNQGTMRSPARFL